MILPKCLDFPPDGPPSDEDLRFAGVESYHDKHGNWIRAGATLRHDSGAMQRVHLCKGSSICMDLGFLVDDSEILKKYPSETPLYYQLREYDLSEWEAVEEKTTLYRVEVIHCSFRDQSTIMQQTDFVNGVNEVYTSEELAEEKIGCIFRDYASQGWEKSDFCVIPFDITLSKGADYVYQVRLSALPLNGNEETQICDQYHPDADHAYASEEWKNSVATLSDARCISNNKLLYENKRCGLDKNKNVVVFAASPFRCGQAGPEFEIYHLDLRMSKIIRKESEIS